MSEIEHHSYSLKINLNKIYIIVPSFKLMSYKSAVDLTQRLMSIDSVSAKGNMGVTRLLAPYLTDLGFHVEHHPISHAGEVLIARLGSQTAGSHGLAFVGHLDTVPYNPEQWDYPPLAGVIDSGRLYGIGATDMKGPIAAMIFAAKRFVGDTLRKPFAIVLTDGEEIGHTGAKYMLAHRLLNPHVADTPEANTPEFKYAVVGEPTSLSPIRAHLGIGETDIIVYGRGGHGSETHLGDNANERAAEVILALKALRIELQAERHKTFEHLYPGLNTGILQGGTAKNVIPEEALVGTQFRILPGYEYGYVHMRIAKVVEELAAKNGFRVRLNHLRDDPGFETSADSELIRFLEGRTGKPSSAVKYSTEAAEMAKLDTEPVVFGPGSINVAHKPNEFVPLEELLQGEEIYADAIRTFCK